MLTRLRVRNFKQFADVDVELGRVTLLVGPNDSGKTTALQALALWEHGLRLWWDRRQASKGPERRPGVTINRRDLVALPVPSADLLWRRRQLRRHLLREERKATQNIRVDIVVEGVTDGRAWTCGLEFDYANPESIYCRPARKDPRDESSQPERYEVPEDALKERVAYLPPMSGLASEEPILMEGAVKVRIGQGRTAEVLRNLCRQVHQRDPRSWEAIQATMRELFGARLDEPKDLPASGAVELAYTHPSGTPLDLSASGRGFQQTLLLLAFLAQQPGGVVLLDEPDAHLEVLRQRQLYRTLCDFAEARGAQIIAASHSEVLLNEAADRDLVIAFVGRPHRMDDRGSQVLKALKELGFEMYLQAEQRGWVLYLEGSTDLAILSSFARRLHHPAVALLDRPFVHYVGNNVRAAQSHFHGLREACPDLVGFGLFDRDERSLPPDAHLVLRRWCRSEIENYLCQPATLVRWAESLVNEANVGPLFAKTRREALAAAMRASIEVHIPPDWLRNREDPGRRQIKASEELLDPIFQAFAERAGLPDLMRKSDYHQLAPFVAVEDLDPEIGEVLDAIIEVAGRARPRTDEDPP